MKTLKFDWNINIGESATKRVVQRKTEFHFMDILKEIKVEKNTCIVILNDNIFSKEDLFNEYYTKLKLPSHFGFNWDSLNDCLVGLEWIKQKNIQIYHLQLPQINEKDLKIYLDILKDSSGEWIGMNWRPEYIKSIYFDLKDYNIVHNLMDEPM
jgi:RNAse (barnase) inhibitor barstar